tara:strand:- start:37 stop:147 length:111 start_codon:yes stop_codon:yes gene_type:complete
LVAAAAAIAAAPPEVSAMEVWREPAEDDESELPWRV